MPTTADHETTGDHTPAGAFARHHAPLLRYAARLTGDPDRAQDIVQDTFAKLLAQPPGSVDGHLAEWLFTVCRHRALDVLRQEQVPQTCHKRPKQRPESLPKAETFSFGILQEGVEQLINREPSPRRLLHQQTPID